MIHKLTSVFLLLSFLSCNTTKKMVTTPNTDLEGIITKNDLLQPPFKEWMEREYKDYQPNMEVLDTLQHHMEWIHQTQIKIFMGTWCGDSQEQVPRFIKILDALNFKSYTIIALNREKKSERGYEEGQKILKVPTFIFLQNRNELNRIVETPINTLEEDIIRIIINQDYTPNYAD